MNLGGWVFMVASFAIILSLIIFCFYRVLTEKDDGQE